MPLVLSNVNTDNLNILTNIFESLYTQFKLLGDMQMLKFVKEILAKLRTEESFRLKKVKSSGLIIPSPNELAKLKGAGIDEMRKKIRLQIISDAMAKNGKELTDFAQRVDLKPEAKPQEEDTSTTQPRHEYSITELAMGVDTISEPQGLRKLVKLSEKRPSAKIHKEEEARSVTELAMQMNTVSNPLGLKKLAEQSEEDEEE